jgi:hypothetical protein
MRLPIVSCVRLNLTPSKAECYHYCRIFVIEITLAKATSTFLFSCFGEIIFDEMALIGQNRFSRYIFF